MQHPLDTEILIEVGPADAVAAADQRPASTLPRRAVQESRIPREGSPDSATILKSHDELLARDAD